MRTSTHLCRLVAFVRPWRMPWASALLMLFALTGVSRPAHAISGLYIQLGGGIADYSGTELIIKEEAERDTFPIRDDPEQCCPPLAVAGSFRLGYSIFGFGGPEFTFIGTGFNSFGGGGGFIGGGLRLYPLKFFSLVGMNVEDFPLDLGVGATFGYTLVGEDFAYTGTFWDVDVTLEYKLTSWLSAGLRLDIILPNFDDFVFTSFSNDRGRCLDGSGMQILDNDGMTSPREDLNCNGRGPDTTVLAPQIVFTIHFSLFGI